MSDSMAANTTCLHGLRRMRLSAWPLRKGIAGRCLESLAALSSVRPLRQQQCGLHAAAGAAQCQPRCAASSFGSSAAPLGLRPSSANPFSVLRVLGSQRQLHVSTVCFGKKKSAEGLVKRISKDDVEFSFARSGGAGGQNVNKVNTKVDMRLKLDAADWLPDDMKEALREKVKNRINSEGELVVTSERTRTQGGNMVDALQKMQKYIDNAALEVQPIESDPEKRKKLAKQKKQANENRLQSKKMKSMKKSDRKSGKRVDF